MSKLPITPSRVFVTVGIIFTALVPHASDNTRLIVGSAIVGVYVAGATIVEAVKHKSATPATIENAVRNAVYAIREEDKANGS